MFTKKNSLKDIMTDSRIAPYADRIVVGLDLTETPFYEMTIEELSRQHIFHGYTLLNSFNRLLEAAEEGSFLYPLYTEEEINRAQARKKRYGGTLLDNLAQTGKLIRLSNFDIKYKDATGANVTVKDITAEQRQKLADFYGYVLKRYMETIPNEKQAGVCKGNMSDTASDPVGLWAVDSKTKDWVRTATYKAFCDALSGKE